ncbi:hypothetical protein LJC08_04750 [Methanimicrococcus sp. OttesenSCG-928-J09]|nr:hypothetical protein [Methanimicrococcus sp. OttesenSCG-928-J09]
MTAVFTRCGYRLKYSICICSFLEYSIRRRERTRFTLLIPFCTCSQVSVCTFTLPNPFCTCSQVSVLHSYLTDSDCSRQSARARRFIFQKEKKKIPRF